MQYNKNLQSFSFLVDQILTAKQQPSSAPLSNGELPIADIFVLEKQIDEMVYALYGPAYRQAGSRQRRLRLWSGRDEKHIEERGLNACSA